MLLKRGLPRQSCDFCHRRKIKCDRLSRARQGLDSCSQCALRDGPCHLDNSGDRRTVKRHRGDADLEGSVVARRRISRDHAPTPVLALTPQAQSLEPQELAATEPLQHIDNMFSDHFLDLNSDNILFLDQIFMDEGEANALHGSSGCAIGASQTRVNEEGFQYQGQPFQVPLLDGGSTGSDPTLTAALHAYFNFAAPWLPILIEDAFWEDFHAGKCSQILISAIACRGMPFTTLADKWEIQQRFANDFREAFLTARSTTPDDGTIRLDDLEALALMVNFEYDNTDSPALHSNLGRLFLKHESLVLMTLQSRIDDRIPASNDSTIPLTRARERRVLLYWHVYGLDAFHCLDRKQLSLIPDKEIGERDDFPKHEARDFLDAIFELALIARQLLQKLCSNSAKRHGIDPKDVHELYAQIYQWRRHTCPPHLRRCDDDESSPDAVHGQRKYTQLHRAVLWALEINCIMQIESFVTDFGLKGGKDLEKEAILSRVQYECLSAVNDMASICRWIDQHPLHGEDGRQHSLVDLAPLALRNVCAGLCFWSSLHGINSIQIANPRAAASHSQDRQKGAVAAHVETATLLRDTAAKAISHRDTVDILERLDKQVALLKSATDSTYLS